MNIIEFERWAYKAIREEQAKGFILQAEEWGFLDDDGNVNCGCLQTILVKHKLGNDGAVKLCCVPGAHDDLQEDNITAQALGIETIQAASLRNGFDHSQVPDPKFKEWYFLGKKFRKFASERSLIR